MSRTLRVLVDANDFLSYFLGSLSPQGTVGQIVRSGLMGEFTLLLPEELVDEIASILTTKDYFAGRVNLRQASEFIATLRDSADLMPPVGDHLPSVVRDPRDDYLIAAALIGRADYLVTGDKDLLALGDLVAPLKIIRPADFVRDVLGDE